MRLLAVTALAGEPILDGSLHHPERPGAGGTVTLIKSNEPAARNPISGAGLVNPWGIAVDGDDNVWLANNWKQVPIQSDPGGYRIVAYLGLAAPIKTPLIGAPERP